MPRKYIRKADRDRAAAIAAGQDDESIVIRYFMERPYAEAATAHRFAGHVLRQRSLAQTVEEPAPPTVTQVSTRRARARRQPADQPSLPAYSDAPESVSEVGEG